MNNPLKALRHSLDAWATSKVVRVALFGHGLAQEEWDGLLTSAYADLRPRVMRVSLVREADLLAIHGPLTPLSWQALLAWVAKRRDETVPVLAVGAELRLDEEGRLLGPGGEKSDFVVTSWLPSHPPAPRELWAAVRCALGGGHV